MEFIYLRSQDNRSLNGFYSPPYHVPTHRLIRIVSGEGTYRFKERELAVKSGDIFLSTPGLRSIEYLGKQEISVQVVNFSAPEYWINEPYIMFAGEGRHYTLLCSLMDDLIFGREKRKAGLLDLAIDLFVEAGEISDGGNRVIQDIAAYIKGNPHLVLAVSELASKAGCSESHFRALFRKEIGMSPKAYIKKTKMDYAVCLMRDENLQVKQVADILGYNDIYEFSKQFKTVFGKPPTKLVKRTAGKL